MPGDTPEETVFRKKLALDLPLLKSKMVAFKEKLGKMHAVLKTKGRSQTAEVKKLRLKVAKSYMALLATKLRFWCTCCTEETQKAVVNVDIRQEQPGSKTYVVFDPVNFKTKWRRGCWGYFHLA